MTDKRADAYEKRIWNWWYQWNYQGEQMSEYNRKPEWLVGAAKIRKPAPSWWNSVKDKKGLWTDIENVDSEIKSNAVHIYLNGKYIGTRASVGVMHHEFAVRNSDQWVRVSPTPLSRWMQFKMRVWWLLKKSVHNYVERNRWRLEENSTAPDDEADDSPVSS